MQTNRLPLQRAAHPFVKKYKNRLVGGKKREQTLLVLSPREAVGFEEKEDCEPLAMFLFIHPWTVVNIYIRFNKLILPPKCLIN
jgi:hypothetical protein